MTVYSNLGTPTLLVNGVEEKNFVIGETDVHYIFQNVKLKEGDNIIQVKASRKGQQFEDKITWHYLKDNPKAISKDGPKSNKNEHIGL
ncbi:hypothetical protein [Sphingobacterium sp. IITKGP-BTPF85]|uniref:hypothetical protein n=1 Tax=Sphingobacterium sp. IITKGP-BTPF85 TaxID=1338009 RepID=UPI0004116023|nr:hypothetical protein [Sphingobacterium sp. IITKGP-BTPF85]KKX50171.1 hypothetical protein L950_0211645 [Sphingobacterium sp. IITKGP-BTPF85]